MKNRTWKTSPSLPSCLEKAPPWTRFLFFSLIALIFLLFFLGTLLLIAYVAVHPRPPLWDIVDLQISTLDVQNGSKLAIITHVEEQMLLLNLDMVIEMSAHNRMKKQGLWYETTIVTAFLYSELGGEVSVPRFYQEGRQVSVQKAAISVRELAITREEEAAKLRAAMASSIKSVDAHVDVSVRANVRILGLLRHHYKLRLHCDVTASCWPYNSTSLISKTCREEKHWLSRS